MTHDESKLPKWAQDRLESQREDLRHLTSRCDKLQLAHRVLTERNWFTVQGPSPDAVYPNDRYHLWYLQPDGAHPACSLGKGDVVLVGRREGK